MKKFLIIFLPLMLILFSCTEKPSKPAEEPKSVYSITLSPTSGSAYVNIDDVLNQEEVINLTVTVKKNNSTYNGAGQINFQTQGAYFTQTLTNTYLADLKNGKATATLFSNYEGQFEVTAYLKVSDSQNTPSATGKYTFFIDPNLKVTGITPNSGTSLGGEQVTISGNGFTFPLEVYFGNYKATYISNTYNEIVVNTPSHISSCCGCNDIVDVKVVLNPGQTNENSYTLSKSFTYNFEAPTPVITGIDPNHGTNNGGTLVTIYGNYFYCSEGILVYFNNAPAKVIECKPNKIIVESPPAYDAGVDNCNQPVDIKVLNVCGGASAKLTGGFKYGPDTKIYSVGPNTGLTSGNETVTIYGQGFNCPVAVSIVGVGAQVISCSNNELVVKTGQYYKPECKDHEGDVVVTDLNCGISAVCRNCYKYISPELKITGISPSSGSSPGTITILGFGFYPPFEILFGSSNALGYDYISDTQIDSVGIPPFTGTYNTENCTDAFGCAGKRNVNTPVDVSVESLSTGCSDKFSSFYYIPPDTTCRTDPPKCSITSNVSGCTITYTAADNCGATYNWTDISGGACASAGNVLSCTYVSSGTKMVLVSITNTGGTATCNGSGTIDAGVNPACP
jgi:hypothetical protein